MRRCGLVLAVVLLVSSVPAFAQCGVERWTIKIGTDSQAPSINLSSYVSNTIYNFYQSAKPATLPPTTRLSPRETTQYQVSGTLTKYKRETDSDYHIVLQDSSGRTMIVEIPSPNCVGGGSPFGTRITTARGQFDARLTATSTMKSTSLPVTIRGIGFWDFIHGQTGVAPNGIEVHPVLNITFNSSLKATSTDDAEVQVPPVPLPADMVEDDDGGRVQVYRGGDAVADVYYHGGTVVESPRLRLVFAGDHWSDAAKQEVESLVRGLTTDARIDGLARYGVGTLGIPFDGPPLFAEHDGEGVRTHARFALPLQLPADGSSLNDLDIQRLLSNAVEQGRLQLLDENVVTLVVLEPGLDLAVGGNRDWASYHSQFHPSELAMRYAVVRGSLDRDQLRESLFASVARTLVNPAGDGWY